MDWVFSPSNNEGKRGSDGGGGRDKGIDSTAFCFQALRET